MNSRRLVLAGVVFWAAVVSSLVWASVRLGRTSGASTAFGDAAGSIVRYSAGDHRVYQVPDLGTSLRLGDPIFLAMDDGGYRGAGFVQSIERTERGREAVLLWHEPEVAFDDCQLLQYRQTGSLSEVAETMLTREKRDRIRRRISDVIRAHGDELASSLEPLLRETMTQSMPVIEASFRDAVARNRSEIEIGRAHV